MPYLIPLPLQSLDISKLKTQHKNLKNNVPNDGGFDAKCIDPNVDDSEKAISIIRPSGSQVAP
jgi:hypothetical protein